jgi:hypothetical protein
VRTLNEDKRRTRNLYDMASQINFGVHGRGSSAPPANLQALTTAQNDPFTGQPYEYHLQEGTGYELCAQFGAASKASSRGTAAEFWMHPAGRHCFEFSTITNPDYPPEYFR